MARFAVAGRATIAGTTVRAVASVYGTTAVRARITEIGVFNTTATALAVAVVRLSATGTQGAGLTEIPIDSPDHVAIATGFAGHTADATVGSPLRQASLGAAIGSGVIWTFPEPLEVAALTTAGVGVIIPTGTGQILDYYIEWIE